MWIKSWALALALLAPGLAFAQPKPRPQPPHGDRQAMEDKVRERVRVIRTARLIEYLNLDEKTATRLLPIVNRVYDEIATVARDTGQARRELRGLVSQGSADAGRMNLLTDKIVANRQKMALLENEGIKQARAVLSPAQGATFVLVLPEINRGIERQIRRAAKAQPALPADDPDLPF